MAKVWSKLVIVNPTPHADLLSKDVLMHVDVSSTPTFEPTTLV